MSNSEMKKESFGKRCSQAFKSAGESISKWAKNMKINYWINLALWLVTFVMLIVIIVIAALKGDDSAVNIGCNLKTYSTIMASLVLVFAILLLASIVHITVVKLIEKKKGGA